MPEQVPLTEGNYQSRSVIANAQRCVNLYADINAKDSPFPYTFYPTAGLVSKWAPAVPAPARGLYTASNGKVFYVVGRNVYYVPPSYNVVQIGMINTSQNPISMKDNGRTIVLADGSPQGWTIDLATNAFAAYGEAAYLGSDRVDYLDGFLLFNQPNTRNFYSTLLNSTTIDPTYIAAKSAQPDNLSRVICVDRLAWLLGVANSEVWANAGAPAFPFQEVPGVAPQHGICAPYSLASHNSMIYFVEQNKDGKGVVGKISGYGVSRISTPAIEAELGTYPTLTDAVGFCYSMLGHIYYVVSFPSADVTWSFDMNHNPPMPHRWGWSDSDGTLHRHRAQCGTYGYDVNLVGDWQNGMLYQLSPLIYNDFGGSIRRIRGFPHILGGKGRLCEYSQFQAEMEVGQDLPSDAQVSLRISNTRGKSFSQPILRSLGSTGDFERVPQWRQLGRARDMVFELEWSFDAQSALNGGFVDFEVTDS